MLKKKVRVAVIGTGFMGGAHAEIYRDWCDNVELAVVASQSEKRASETAAEYGFERWTTDWRQVMQAGDVDFIDITAPNHLHRDMVIAAAEAGIPFAVEKPLARNLAEADEIMEVVARTGTKGMYSENVRHGNEYKHVKNIIDQGGIGKPYLVQAYEMHSGPTHAD